MTVKDTTEFFCEACHLRKLHKLPFDKAVVKVATKPGEFVHSDVRADASAIPWRCGVFCNL